MESATELEWFRGEIWRSLAHPRDFARDLAREHYGIAGVLVALVAGVALSLGIDLLVLASKGLALGPFLPRLIADAGLLGVRLAISAAVVAWITAAVVRLLRRGGSLDQVFTALTFGLVPLVLVPIPGIVAIVATADAVLALAAAALLVLVARVVVGIALNMRGILPPAIAAIAFIFVIVLGALVMNDEVSRVRYLSYAIAPQLVGGLAASPATGKRYDMLGFDLTVPAGWTNASTGVRGEAAAFESATARLLVQRASAAALDTADTYADIVMGTQLVGVHQVWHDRTVERVNGMLVVDDRYGGSYEGRQVLWRQFTAVPATEGLALVYRVVEPADRGGAFAEAASIAATWHIAGVRP